MSPIGHNQRSGREHGYATGRSIDRRVTRTRGVLHQALLSLILEKGYDAISVDDICQRANVGRSTFYGHFTGKDDLKRSGLDEHFRALLVEGRKNAISTEGASARRLAFSLSLFEHARDHLDLYRTLASGRGGAVSLGAIRQVVTELVCDEISGAGGQPEDAPREIVVTYVVGGKRPAAAVQSA